MAHVRHAMSTAIGWMEVVGIISTAPHAWASRDPGTHGKWLWLLPSGPDQVDHAAMRGGPPTLILLSGYLAPIRASLTTPVTEPERPGRPGA